MTSKYRIVLYKERYHIQKWFPVSRFLGIKVAPEGWYSRNQHEAGWGLPTYRWVTTFNTREKAIDAFRAIIEEEKHLPEPDSIPITSITDTARSLRLAYLSNLEDAMPALVYADWLDENGFNNSAERIRTLYKISQEYGVTWNLLE